MQFVVCDVSTSIWNTSSNSEKTGIIEFLILPRTLTRATLSNAHNRIFYITRKTVIRVELREAAKNSCSYCKAVAVKSVLAVRETCMIWWQEAEGLVIWRHQGLCALQDTGWSLGSRIWPASPCWGLVRFNELELGLWDS